MVTGMAYVAGLVQSSEAVAPEQDVGEARDTITEPVPFPGRELTSLVRDWLTTSEDLDRHAVAARALEVPALPRRGDRHDSPARRLAVLIDASTTPPAHADALFELLADAGRITVCRAYADWTAPTSQAWRSRLRAHGIQPQHHFSSQGDQRAMVAMTVEAVDLARESAVDAVAVVGDLGSAHPLVARLNASGVAVLGLGPSHTPYDVRALCEEFIDLSFLDVHRSRGRHRA
jgi:hypothetical protein